MEPEVELQGSVSSLKRSGEARAQEQIAIQRKAPLSRWCDGDSSKEDYVTASKGIR
jgi:hypothetical protein